MHTATAPPEKKMVRNSLRMILKVEMYKSLLKDQQVATTLLEGDRQYYVIPGKTVDYLESIKKGQDEFFTYKPLVFLVPKGSHLFLGGDTKSWFENNFPDQEVSFSYKR